MTVKLKRGQVFHGSASDFIGCPETPFDSDQLLGKFRRLFGGDEAVALRRFNALFAIDQVAAVDLLDLGCFDQTSELQLAKA